MIIGNQKGETLLDIVLIAGMLVLWIVPCFVLAALNFWNPGGFIWGAFWTALAVLLGIAELFSKLKTGRTLTQHLRKWGKESDKNKWTVRAILGTWTAGWILLMIHLWV